MSKPEYGLIIGTGFWCTASESEYKHKWLHLWIENTRKFCPDFERIVLVDNSEPGCLNNSPYIQKIRIENNLGHVADGFKKYNQLQGWSLSWIISALVAYSEECHFVYKEQDCLAFNDWLGCVTHGEASFGKHHQLACEQSLFFIERDFIPRFVQMYMSIPDPDAVMIPEQKFAEIAKMSGYVRPFDMPCGRSRPIPACDKQPWYAQKFLPNELNYVLEAYHPELRKLFP